MTDNIKSLNQWGYVIFLAIIIGFVPLSATCKNPSEAFAASSNSLNNPTTATAPQSADMQATSGTRETQKFNQTTLSPHSSQGDILTAIQKCQSFVQLYNMEQNYMKTAVKSEAANQAFINKWKALTAKMDRQTMTPEIDLITFEWKKIAKESQNQWGLFQATWLFYVKSPIKFKPEIEERLILRGDFDSMFLDIWRKKYPNKKNLEMTYQLNPPITKWPSEHYQVVTKEVLAPAVPISLLTFFALVRGEDPLPTYAGPYGDHLSLGWRAP